MYYTDHPIEQSASNFMYRVYGLMSVALSITAVTAYLVATTPAFYQALFYSSWLLMIIFIAQIGIVIAFIAFL